MFRSDLIIRAQALARQAQRHNPNDPLAWLQTTDPDVAPLAYLYLAPRAARAPACARIWPSGEPRRRQERTELTVRVEMAGKGELRVCESPKARKPWFKYFKEQPINIDGLFKEIPHLRPNHIPFMGAANWGSIPPYHPGKRYKVKGLKNPYV